MRTLRDFSLALVAILVLGTAGLAGPGGQGPRGGQGARETTLQKGEPFCPSAALVAGTIIIQPGRCYVLLVLRNTQGTFLAFADPGAKIPPGQLVRLSTPAGAKVKGRIFYLIPLHATLVVIPADTMTVVAARVDDLGPQVSITIVGTAAPNLTVYFSVKM